MSHDPFEYARSRISWLAHELRERVPDAEIVRALRDWADLLDRQLLQPEEPRSLPPSHSEQVPTPSPLVRLTTPAMSKGFQHHPMQRRFTILLNMRSFHFSIGRR